MPPPRRRIGCRPRRRAVSSQLPSADPRPAADPHERTCRQLARRHVPPAAPLPGGRPAPHTTSSARAAAGTSITTGACGPSTSTTDALRNYQFVVHRLEARLRDGTLVRVPEDGALTPIDLRAGLEQQNPLEVSLAIPAVQMGRANVGAGHDGTRFRAYTPRDGVPDENSGQNPRPVQFRVLNLRLVTGAQDVAGYEVLPIARVARSARAEAVPELHEPYIPPVLACDAWPVLQRGIIQQIYHRVGKLVDQRASQIRSRRITFDSNSPGDRQIFESLRVLNETAAYLGVMGDAAGVHPLPAYLELCRLVGRLAIFGPDAKPPELPRYDHDDLGGCFFTVKRYIDDLLTHGGFSLGYEERPFVGEGLRMKVTLEPAWLAPAWQMFVGVESPMPTADLVPLLTGRLNMKIGSIERVDEIFQRGLRGLAFAYNPKPPRALPESRTLTYFQINRDTSPDEWRTGPEFAGRRHPVEREADRRQHRRAERGHDPHRGADDDDAVHAVRRPAGAGE